MFLFYFDFSITFYMRYYFVLVSGIRTKTCMSLLNKLQDFSEPFIYSYAAFLKLIGPTSAFLLLFFSKSGNNIRNLTMPSAPQKHFSGDLVVLLL